MDYPVVNYGMDGDTKDSLDHLRLATKLIGHEWEFKTDASWEKWRNKAKDTMYNYHMTLDPDMVDSKKNEVDAEGKFGQWDLVGL